MSKSWLIATILFLALSLPLVVYVTQQSQEIRQRAAPYPSATPAPPPPGPRCGSSHFICSWHRNSSNRYFMICEWPESGNGNDGIGRQGQSTSGDIGLCQEKQDDSQYCNLADCNCAPGDPRPKRITWTAKGPRGVSCSYTYDFCRAGEPGYNGEHAGDCSSTELNPPPPPANPLLWNWNFNECAKCTGGANATWNSNGSVTINSITAQNYRPILEPFDDPSFDGSPNDTRVKTATGGFDARSELDFRIQILDTTNPASPVVLRTETIFNSDSRITCTYPTTDSYCTRDAANHRVDCSLLNYIISGLTFQPGRTYSLKTWIKLGYADDTAWVDYVADSAGNINRNICNSSFTIPTASPSPSPSPSASPSPSPTPSPPTPLCPLATIRIEKQPCAYYFGGRHYDLSDVVIANIVQANFQARSTDPSGGLVQLSKGANCSATTSIGSVSPFYPNGFYYLEVATIIKNSINPNVGENAFGVRAAQNAELGPDQTLYLCVTPSATPTPRPSPSPSPSPTPTPSPVAMCRAVRLYRLTGPIDNPASWNLISDNLSELQALRPGDVVYATIWGEVTNGTIDRGRIRMNPALGQPWTTADETTVIKPASSPIEYYKPFTLPANTINFRFEGEVHEAVQNKWY